MVFGPDHFNGQLYSLITPWVIGAAAEGVGDYGTTAGTLPVDADAAGPCTRPSSPRASTSAAASA